MNENIDLLCTILAILIMGLAVMVTIWDVRRARRAKKTTLGCLFGSKWERK